MLTEKELTELADYFANIYAKASEEIMTEIGKNIKRTGDLTPSQAKSIQQMHKSGADMRKLDAILKRTSGKGLSDMQALYEYAVSDSYDWAEPFYRAKGLTSIPLKDNPALKTMLNAIARSSGKELTNLSRTTAIGIDTAKGFAPLDKFYKDTVNKAILSASTGAESYQKAVHRAVKELGGSGLRIQYESGQTRRLDSAVRQNILDGMSYIAQETAKYHGEQFGADGYEISAHSPCAPDHLPHQGLQYTKDEFEDLQSGLDRQIGEWNCRHIAYPIIVGVSGAANSREELAEMERYSNEKIEIDGHEYTRYECSQIQRRLETEMRKANEQRILGKNSGVKDLERQARERLNQLTNKYAEVSRKSDLPVKAERMRAVEKSLKEKAGLGSGKVGDSYDKSIIEIIREIDYNNEKDVLKELKNFTEKYLDSDKEHAYVISPNGNLYEIQGDSATVHIELAGEDALKNAIVIHNHPGVDGDSFSDLDFGGFFGYEIKDLYVVNHINGKSVQRMSFFGERFEYGQAMREYDRALDRILQIAKDSGRPIQREQLETMVELEKTIKGLAFGEVKL